MEAEAAEGGPTLYPLVKATFRLGDETHDVCARKGTTLSGQLASFKEESMEILKEFITKHNAPAEVPDEPLEGSDGEDDGEIPAKPPVKKRKSEESPPGPSFKFL
uniref:Uncharacterized protein n=1 Tax=Kalanchoe fedtschenkoi TaxID=63787 RepID=A0A7N0R9X8_KALFE